MRATEDPSGARVEAPKTSRGVPEALHRRGRIELRLGPEGKRLWVDGEEARCAGESEDGIARQIEVLERLAARMGQGFGQALSTFGAFAEHLSAREGEDAARRRYREEVQEAVQKLRRWTLELFAFGRERWTEPVEVGLNRLVTDVEARLAPKLHERIQLKVVPGAERDHVIAAPGQIETIVRNLVANAAAAMPRGGAIVVETSNAGGSGSAREETATACLSVVDSGEGMTAEVAAHLFEPCCSTRPAGAGTGLGLALVYRLVRQCGGHIHVTTEPGRGTAVRIFFPALPGRGEPERDGTAVPVSEYCGSETILLVDDERDFRLLGRQMLEDYGYRVLDAADGLEALNIAREYEGTIDLLLCDLVMPLMSGRELAERFEWFRPQAKILFMSGYANEVVGRYGLLKSHGLLLEKPFTPAGLTRRVRQVLGERPRERAPSGAGRT